jgi:UDPglucose 6-dehydrogenase
MKIGIIGLGVVGRAIMDGLKQIGQKVSYYDIKFSETTLFNVLDTEIVFVCVPTNSTVEENCDTSIVESVVSQLMSAQYKGIVAIKSTVIPKTTQRLIEEYNNQNICFVPEFLRQRCALSDFHDYHDVLVIGTDNSEVYYKIKESHRSIPVSVIQVTPTEAEIVKYFNNVHNAMEIVFANAVYEMTNSLGANYQNVFDAVTKRRNINPSYLRCSDQFKGYGGACLPKDLAAWAILAKDLGVNVELFNAIINDNKRYI